MYFNHLHDGLVINSNNITSAISTIKAPLLNSIVISQQSNWILITQIEFYYKDTEIDDTAMVNKHDKYSNQLEIAMEKRQEGCRTWFELCFVYQMFEIIATGSLYSNEGDTSKFGALLDVTAPSHVAHDTNFILLSPNTTNSSNIMPKDAA